MPAYWLGIDLGTTSTAVAICWPAADGLQVQVLPLSGRSYAMPSVLFLPGDGSLVAGDEAERRALADPYRVVREFRSRVGDEIPLLVAGTPYYAHDLAAEFVSWLCRYVTEQEGERPEAVALTCPASWGPDRTALLERAVRRAGVPSVTMLTEPEAAAISYAGHSDAPAGGTLAVCDLGAARFDVAVLRREAATSFTVLGRSEGIEGLGGLSFDEVIFEYVCAAAGVPLEEMDLSDHGLAAEVTQLRRECTDAKETLSASNDAIISVTLGGTQHWVRLTRAEFEEMIRPDLDRTIEAMHRAFGSADVVAAGLEAILLTGGSARIPLVAQLIGAEFGRPPVIAPDPKAAVAMGAARYCAPAATPVRELAAAPAAGGERGRPGLRHLSRRALLSAAAVIVLVVAGAVTALRTPVLSGLTSHHGSTHAATASGGLAPSVSGAGHSPTPSAPSSAKPAKAGRAARSPAASNGQVASGPTSAAAAAAQAGNPVTSPARATRSSAAKPPVKTSTEPAAPPTSATPSAPPASTTPAPSPSATTLAPSPSPSAPSSSAPPTNSNLSRAASSSVTPSTSAAARA